MYPGVVGFSSRYRSRAVIPAESAGPERTRECIARARPMRTRPHWTATTAPRTQRVQHGRQLRRSDGLERVVGAVPALRRKPGRMRWPAVSDGNLWRAVRVPGAHVMPFVLKLPAAMTPMRDVREPPKLALRCARGVQPAGQLAAPASRRESRVSTLTSHYRYQWRRQRSAPR